MGRDIDDDHIITRENFVDAIGCGGFGVELIAAFLGAGEHHVAQGDDFVIRFLVGAQMPLRDSAATNDGDSGAIAFRIARSIR